MFIFPAAHPAETDAPRGYSAVRCCFEFNFQTIRSKNRWNHLFPFSYFWKSTREPLERRGLRPLLHPNFKYLPLLSALPWGLLPAGPAATLRPQVGIQETPRPAPKADLTHSFLKLQQFNLSQKVVLSMKSIKCVPKLPQCLLLRNAIRSRTSVIHDLVFKYIYCKANTDHF